MESKDVEKLIAAAWKAVDKAEIPEHVQQVAFKEAVSLLVSDAPSGPPSGGADRGGDGPGSGGGGRNVADGPLADIAKKLEVTEEQVAQLFFVDDDGELSVSIPHQVLTGNVASAARLVSLICASGRQAAELDTKTSFEVLKREVTRLAVYDSKNYISKHIRGEKNWWTVQGEAIRVTPKGFTAATEKIREIAS